jgi:signal transduction histidine kinase
MKTLLPDRIALRAALANWWFATRFASRELSDYATPHLVQETRRGVALMSMVTLVFLLMSALFSTVLKLGGGYTHTYLLLAALALHVHLSSYRISQVPALNLLGMVLLIVCGSSLVLLARDIGQLHELLLLNVAVLLMLVPLVPWGLREAATTAGAIYLMFTSLSFFSRSSFAPLQLWVLQFMMVAAGLVTMILVIRALALRKHDLNMRFNLERWRTAIR